MKKLIEFIQKNYDNYDVTIEQKDSNNIVITMKKTEKEEINKKINEFKDYVKKIDDEFFTDICDIFNTLSDKNVNELSKLLNDANDLKAISKYTNDFKNITKEFIKEHIKKLENKYL